MKKNIVKALSFALAFVTVASLVACQKQEDDFSDYSVNSAETGSVDESKDTTDTEDSSEKTEETEKTEASEDTEETIEETEETDETEETTTPDSEIYVGESVKVQLVDNSNHLYRLLRADNASSTVKNKITSLKTVLENKTGKTITYKSFSAMVGTGADDYEILIGDTGRAESTGVTNTLRAKDFYVGIKGKKIVIAGGSDAALIEAIDYFIENALTPLSANATEASMPSEYKYSAKYIAPNLMIGEKKAAEYSIVHIGGNICDSTEGYATKIQNAISEITGVDIKASAPKNTEINPYEIVIGHVERDYSLEFYKSDYQILDYSAKIYDGRLYICAGSEWGFDRVVNHIVSEYIKKGKDIPSDFEYKGSLYGENLFPIPSGTDVRIMSNNVWRNVNNTSYWIKLGADCSQAHRSIGFATLYLAYMPDVINFQEMGPKMANYIVNYMNKEGHNYKLYQPLTAASCSIAYNADRLNLLESGYHSFAYGNNGGKGYTWGYFEVIATGEKFISMSSHWEWQSGAEFNQNRENQALEIVEKTKSFYETYKCPIFLGGDLNTTSSSTAFKNLTNGGYEYCYDIADVKDNHSGRHPCDNKGFSRGTAGNNSAAIDHTLVYGLGNSKINSFKRCTPYFAIKLSDHYPLYVDVTLNK